MDMFDDVTCECYDIIDNNNNNNDTFDENIPMISIGTQKDAPLLSDIGIQSIIKTDNVETQTESLNYWYDANDDVAIFVNNVYDMVSEALNENITSNILENYDVIWEEERQSVNIDKSIDCESKSNSMSVSCVSWNCNGHLISVGYGENDHIGWCEHRAGINIWQYNMKDNVINIETPSCVTCLSFHPVEYTIFIVGLFSGELRLFDISEKLGKNTSREASINDELLATSAIDDLYHCEPIQQVKWLKRDLIRSAKNKLESHYLISISGDGHILFWDVTRSLNIPNYGFRILPTAKYHGHGITLNRWNSIGATSIGFSLLDSRNCVVGTEGGGVLKVSNWKQNSSSNNNNTMIQLGDFQWTNEAHNLLMNAPGINREIQRTVEKYARINALKYINIEAVFAAKVDPLQLYPSAATFAYKVHSGTVLAIKFSPFHRNLFLTASMDGSLRLYHALRATPIMIVESRVLQNCIISTDLNQLTHHSITPGTAVHNIRSDENSYITDIDWSPCRPTVFACSTNDDRIHIFDLSIKMDAPVVSLKTLKPIINILFHPTDGSKLLSLDENNKIIIFHLSSQLSEFQTGDNHVIEHLGKTGNHATKTKLKAIKAIVGLKALIS